MVINYIYYFNKLNIKLFSLLKKFKKELKYKGEVLSYFYYIFINLI